MLAVLCMGSDALAAAGCVRREEMTALRVAAVQQQLMVAALSCDTARLYNSFVLNYRRELQDSDETLKGLFQRMSGGLDDYHAFKTRLANQSSLRSIWNTDAYCEEANDAFRQALNSEGLSLEDFVRSRRVSLDVRFAICDRTAAAESQNARSIMDAPNENGFAVPRDHTW